MLTCTAGKVDSGKRKREEADASDEQFATETNTRAKAQVAEDIEAVSEGSLGTGKYLLTCRIAHRSCA